MKLRQRFQTLRKAISEQATGLRVSFSGMRKKFWPLDGVGRLVVNSDKTRAAYRNTMNDMNLAAGFTKRIIDAVPEFMGMPHSASGDENVDEQVNRYIRDFWSSEIQQMVKDACRDSRTVVRFRKHNEANPLVSTDERDGGFLEVIPPEKTNIFYAIDGSMEMALISHEIEEVDEESFDLSQGREPRTTVHQITEEITPDGYRYFDHTTGEERDDLNQPNPWGFVPLVEVFNEYESYLEGGQSDLEPCYPFLKAFHDVMTQALTAHKYHSIPKAVFNINDVQTFLMNNYPESFQQDENGVPISGTFNGTVSWKGTEILFLQTEEQAGFIEAKSVLGDSQNLLGFLLDCIVISSETPKWVIMVDVGAADRSETLTFIKRIERKRRMYAPYIQQIVKMSLASNGQEPVLVQLEWDEIDPDKIVTLAQAMQQATMSVELLAERRIISDRTVREFMRKYIPNMKAPDAEAEDAKDNEQLTGGAGSGFVPNSPNGRQVIPAGDPTQ